MKQYIIKLEGNDTNAYYQTELYGKPLFSAREKAMIFNDYLMAHKMCKELRKERVYSISVPYTKKNKTKNKVVILMGKNIAIYAIEN